MDPRVLEESAVCVDLPVSSDRRVSAVKTDPEARSENEDLQESKEDPDSRDQRDLPVFQERTVCPDTLEPEESQASKVRLDLPDPPEWSDHKDLLVRAVQPENVDTPDRKVFRASLVCQDLLARKDPRVTAVHLDLLVVLDHRVFKDIPDSEDNRDLLVPLDSKVARDLLDRKDLLEPPDNVDLLAQLDRADLPAFLDLLDHPALLERKETSVRSVRPVPLDATVSRDRPVCPDHRVTQAREARTATRESPDRLALAA